MEKECEHVPHENASVKPKTKGCEECEREHLPTVATRICLTCGPEITGSSIESQGFVFRMCSGRMNTIKAPCEACH